MKKETPSKASSQTQKLSTLKSWEHKFSQVTNAESKQQAMEYAILEAATNGELENVRVLLELGADSRACANSVAILALKNGHNAVVICLLCHQTKLEERVAKNYGLLYLATLANNLPMVELLWDKKPQKKAATYMRLAAKRGYIDLVSYYIRKGVKINQPNGRKETALHLAVQGGHLETIHCLLTRGADLELTDCRGYTPLMSAIHSQHAKVILYLLDAGANKNLKLNKETPYTVAKRLGYFDAEVLKALKQPSCFEMCCGCFFHHSNNTAKVMPETETKNSSTSHNTSTPNI